MQNNNDFFGSSANAEGIEIDKPDKNGCVPLWIAAGIGN